MTHDGSLTRSASNSMGEHIQTRQKRDFKESLRPKRYTHEKWSDEMLHVKQDTIAALDTLLREGIAVDKIAIENARIWLQQPDNDIRQMKYMMDALHNASKDLNKKIELLFRLGKDQGAQMETATPECAPPDFTDKVGQ